MSVEKINLRKILQLFFADPRQQRSLLLADIRNDRQKEEREGEGGGDFFGPFWSDVKDHVAGHSDITEQTRIRISKNEARRRLYPELEKSFLHMWMEKIRWRNEPFEFTPESVKAQLPIKKLGLIKIENTASIRTWDKSHRVIYPYFSEAPALPEEGARLGFWALREALPDYRPEDFRIIDFIRRSYFRPNEIGTKGDEEEQFIKRYTALLKEWRKLRDKA